MSGGAMEWVIFGFAMLFALTFHEVAHGYVADRLGDPTARLAGRLTLNPIRHLDLLGTLVFVVTKMVGWAKPVPVNPGNFRDPRRGMLWVSIAGPAANFALAVIGAALFRLVTGAAPAGAIMANKYGLYTLALMLNWLVVVNVALGIFNLIPIPPLDGSNALAALIPESWMDGYKKFARFGPFLLILLILSPFVRLVLGPTINFFHHLLVG